jgi:hypothetical protein
MLDLDLGMECVIQLWKGKLKWVRK